MTALRRVLQPLRSRRLAPVLCAAVVLLAGARLVTLSLEQHAAAARSSAQAFADRAAQALQQQLQALTIQARSRAALASSSRAGGSATLAALPPARHAFWLAGARTPLGVLPADRQAARDIASQWSGSSGAVLTVQAGTGWLVAVRASLPAARAAAGTGAATLAPAWAVVYRPLGSLLLPTGLDQATRRGYDFALSLREPGGGRLLPLLSSRPGALTSPVVALIALPAASPLAGAAGGAAPAVSWQLALRPRAGWFPAADWVVESSLVLLLAWLVALGVADVSRHLGHLRSALTNSRRRLQSAQQRLAEELERRERLQKSFDHAHYHDAFTGLPNRRYFLDQVDRGLREQRTRPGREIAVLLIAVGRFRVVTDTLGHTAGDELMVQITRRVTHALGAHECVIARWSDAELALMVSGVHAAEEVLQIAHPLQQALQTPIELRRHRVLAAISMGATYVEGGLQRAEEVLREADIALSAAREQGGARLVTYSSSMQTHLMQLVSLEADLQLALERREFRLLYQPIVELQARRIVGMEVLLRWLHPLEGMLRPERCLASAEEAGIGVPITRWIIQHACQLARHWQAQLPDDAQFYFSVNLSTSALLDPQLAEYVAQTLARCSLPAHCLKFELTESSLISNMGAARHALDRLHALGVELMLDDFGTGYSSLSHLQLFPFDYIKIERGTWALVRAMTRTAAALGLKTVAEIVESTASVRSLQQLGCQFAQGHAFGAPVDADLAFQQLCAGILEPRDSAAPEAPSPEDDSATLILPVLPETVID
jgi:diguanylate cyclase (GGDEF)-like protein